MEKVGHQKRKIDEKETRESLKKRIHRPVSDSFSNGSDKRPTLSGKITLLVGHNYECLCFQSVNGPSTMNGSIDSFPSKFPQLKDEWNWTEGRQFTRHRVLERESTYQLIDQPIKIHVQLERLP